MLQPHRRLYSPSWQGSMSKNHPPFTDRTPVNFPPTLTDRVRDRVVQAGRAIDSDDAGDDTKVSKLRHTRLGMSTGRPKADSQALREARSLRRVYRELRGTYRRHRRATGHAALPELRDAVHAFKRGPSLKSLVSVAVFLDERRLLTW